MIWFVAKKKFTEKGGFVTISYNKHRNIIAWLLTQVCNDVGVESMLQALTEEKLTGCSDCVVEDKNVDKSARGFWAKN